MTNKGPGAESALGEFVSFSRSALGLDDPATRLRALASLGTSLLRVNRGIIVKGHRKAPQKPLELFEAEYCPFCRHVREALTELDLDAMIYPVPKRGERFRAPVRIDASVRSALCELSRLAPLHNPANLVGIEACEAAFPGGPQVAVFGTAFHQTLPPRAFRYAIPEAWYREHGVRRYGFHGTSHRYVAYRYRQLSGKSHEETNLITVRVRPFNSEVHSASALLPGSHRLLPGSLETALKRTRPRQRF